MNKVLNFDEYKIITEKEKELDSYLDNVNESIAAAVGNPIKFTKLRNNAKQYQQALVQKSLNNVNFEKKKAASQGGDKEQKEVLNAANAAKNKALTDKADAISDRMDQLATSNALKAVNSLAKSKAKIAAAEISLKAADEEETKALKIQIKNLADNAAKQEKAIKDYEKKADDTKTDDNFATVEDKPETEVENKPKTSAAEKPTKKETTAEKNERERKEAISKKIEDAMITISKAESEKKLAEKERDDLSKQLNDAAKGTPEENRLSKEVSSATDAVNDIDKEIEKLRNNIKELRDELKN